MSRLPLALILFLCLVARADDAAVTKTPVTEFRDMAPLMPEKTLHVTELFNLDENPGTGSLVFTAGEKKEEAKFGTEGGNYAVGMIFTGSDLPDQFKQEFKSQEVIHVTLGALQANLKGQIPQFGAFTVVTPKAPDEKTRYRIVVPTKKENGLTDVALGLFNSPSAPNERSDEDKLKGTFILQSGTLIYSPLTPWTTKQMKTNGQNGKFRVRLVRMEIEAQLLTPFSAQKATLAGAMEFPLYQPTGDGGEKITRQISSQSIGGTPAPFSPKKKAKKPASD